MEAIQAEMNTVIDEMAEMESRLLAQQEALSSAASPTLQAKPLGQTSRKQNKRNQRRNGAARNRTNGASRPEFVEARRRTSSAISRTVLHSQIQSFIPDPRRQHTPCAYRKI